MIDETQLKNFLDQLEITMQEKVVEADDKADASTASESYRADMHGFSRGLYQGKNLILGALRERFLKE